MKFEEKGEHIITLPPYEERGVIYFIIKDEEVIYVGQSKKGIKRPYDHRHDKDFDTIKIFFCGLSNLDYAESYFIYKYDPKYNVDKRARRPYTMQGIKKCLKVLFDNVPSIKVIKRVILKEAGINLLYKSLPTQVDGGCIFKVQEYLNFDGYLKLVKFLAENPQYGAVLKDTEGFNVWEMMDD